MNQFVPSVDQVKPHWFERWGATFGSPELALEMFHNERLRSRTYDQLLAHSDIEIDAEFSDIELACLHSFMNNRSRLEQVCGLVVFGHHVRDSIARSDFESLCKLFDIDDLKLAIELREFHPEGETFAADLTRLQEMVTRAGKACLSVWREHQSEQIQLRLALVDETPLDQDPAHLPMAKSEAVSLVERVGTQLASI